MEEQSTQTASIEEIQQRFKGWRAQKKRGTCQRRPKNAFIMAL
jgi:hypothetical protein